MSCMAHGCLEETKYLCKDCPDYQLFCINHLESHKKNHSNHLINEIDEEEINSIKKDFLQKEIDKNLSRILNDSIILIRAFKETSQLQILETKSLTEGPVDIPFKINEFLKKLASENLIKKGTFFLDEDIDKRKVRVKDLTSEIDKLRIELDNKEKELEDLKKEKGESEEV